MSRPVNRIHRAAYNMLREDLRYSEGGIGKLYKWGNRWPWSPATGLNWPSGIKVNPSINKQIPNYHGVRLNMVKASDLCTQSTSFLISWCMWQNYQPETIMAITITLRQCEGTFYFSVQINFELPCRTPHSWHLEIGNQVIIQWFFVTGLFHNFLLLHLHQGCIILRDF